MPLLTTIGTALGGFVSGYDQAKQQEQMRQMRQAALQQQQQQQKAGDAAFAALQQGAGGRQPLGGGIPGAGQSPPPIPPIPQMPMAGMGGQGQPAPMPAPQAPPAPMPTPQAPPQAPQQPGPLRLGITPGMARGFATPGGNQPAPLPPGGPPAQAPVPQPAPAPPQMPAAAGGVAPGAAGPAQPPGLDPEIAALMHQTRPQDLAAAVKAARPDIDGETAMLAVERLSKILNSGDRMQTAMAGQLLRYLSAEQGMGSHERIAGHHDESHERVVGQQQAGADYRTSQNIVSREKIAADRQAATAQRSKDRDDRIDRRFDASMEQRQATAQQKADAERVKDTYKAVLTQLAIMKAEAGPDGPTTPGDKAKFRALGARAAQIWSQLQQSGAAIEGPADLLRDDTPNDLR